MAIISLTLATWAFAAWVRQRWRVSDELLTAFLLHVGDVRDHLDDLILHARERLEKKARREGGVSDEDAILQRLWNDAMHDEEAAEGHDRS